MEKLTLEAFEEASEIVSQVTQETKLVYSEYFSNQTGNKVYFKPENMQYTALTRSVGLIIRSALCQRKKRQEGW